MLHRLLYETSVCQNACPLLKDMKILTFSSRKNLGRKYFWTPRRHPLVISCEFVKGSPRLKIILNGKCS
ncbi:unnamed protein product, partial [Vitis vinifera]|uniref:Uncharacterized protein n=1 Tax=Vitis vinifera TaxID=29760 RepID=D7TH20_VITVI